MTPTPPCFETASGCHYSPFMVSDQEEVEPIALTPLSPFDVVVGKCMGKLAPYFEFDAADTRAWQEWLCRFGWDLPPVQSRSSDPIETAARRVFGKETHGLSELATHAWSHALMSLRGEPTQSRDEVLFEVAVPLLADRCEARGVKQSNNLPTRWDDLLGENLVAELSRERHNYERDLLRGSQFENAPKSKPNRAALAR